MSDVEVLTRERVYPGKVVDLWIEEVALPNGRTAQLEVVRHPGAAAIVPIDADGNVVLVRQYRHALGRYLLEVPAGKLSPGELPIDCAARELEEEIGERAGCLEALGALVPAPGFADEVIHLFLATELAASRQQLDDDEILSVERKPLAEVVAMALDGRLDDSKSVVAVLRASHRMASPG